MSCSILPPDIKKYKLSCKAAEYNGKQKEIMIRPVLCICCKKKKNQKRCFNNTMHVYVQQRSSRLADASQFNYFIPKSSVQNSRRMPYPSLLAAGWVMESEQHAGRGPAAPCYLVRGRSPSCPEASAWDPPRKDQTLR